MPQGEASTATRKRGTPHIPSQSARKTSRRRGAPATPSRNAAIQRREWTTCLVQTANCTWPSRPMRRSGCSSAAHRPARNGLKCGTSPAKKEVFPANLRSSFRPRRRLARNSAHVPEPSAAFSSGTSTSTPRPFPGSSGSVVEFPFRTVILPPIHWGLRPFCPFAQEKGVPIASQKRRSTTVRRLRASADPRQAQSGSST